MNQPYGPGLDMLSTTQSSLIQFRNGNTDHGYYYKCLQFIAAFDVFSIFSARIKYVFELNSRVTDGKTLVALRNAVCTSF